VIGGANIGTGKLKLSWNAIPTTTPIRYFVYYDTIANSYNGSSAIEGQSPIDIGDTTSFILSGLVPEKTYYISISVYEPISELESERTNEVSEPCGNNIPSPITTLTISSITDHSVKLKWTATGDDSITGTASAYDIRYSTTPITDSTYNTSSKISNNPVPSESGIMDGVVVAGLQSSTTYYFAIKARDEANNWSLLSNIVAGTTLRDTTAPNNVLSVSTFSGDNFITFKWTKPQDGDFAGVLITRKLGSEPTFIPMDSINYAIDDTIAIDETIEYCGNDTTFTNSGLTNGVNYYY
jgi:hypothetical protein